MQRFDWLPAVTPFVAPALAVGETLRAAAPVSLTLGSDQVLDAQRAADRQALADEIRRASAPRPSKSAASAGTRFLKKVTGGLLDLASETSPLRATAPDLPNPNGTGLVGGPTSAAVRLRDLLTGQDEHALAVSDRRLFVLLDRDGPRARRRRDGSVPPYELLSELPLTDLISLQRKPVQLSRARTEITFTDGSMLAVTFGTKDSAEQIIAAVSTPRYQ